MQVIGIKMAVFTLKLQYVHPKKFGNFSSTDIHYVYTIDSFRQLFKHIFSSLQGFAILRSAENQIITFFL